jgi:hypothetical protein
MRRLMHVGLWALLLALVAFNAPGLHGLGSTAALAADDPNGSSYDQDSGTGGGGGAGASYGDPDGPQAGSKSRSNPWRINGGSWRGAGVYGQARVTVGSWSVRGLILGLRYYYLRF